MDSFELNKILGAVLGTCLFVLALNITAGALYTPEKPTKPGYEIAVTEQPAGGQGAAPAADEPIEKLLAAATVDRGAVAAKKCQACHTFEKNGPNRVGPNLWGVIGRQVAAHQGFDYSAAMKAKGGTWTIEELNKFLLNPRGDVPGTKMSFAGLPRGTERADVIAYLNSLADSPQPLPKAAEAAPQAGAAAPQAGGAAPAADPQGGGAAPQGAATAAPAPAGARPANEGAQPNSQGQNPPPKQ